MEPSGPLWFWHQGPVSGKTVFLWMADGKGVVQAIMCSMIQEIVGVMESDSKRQMKLCLLLTYWRVVRFFLTGCGLVLVQGPRVGDPGCNLWLRPQVLLGFCICMPMKRRHWDRDCIEAQMSSSFSSPKLKRCWWSQGGTRSTCM